jgi:hypothetical protein
MSAFFFECTSASAVAQWQQIIDEADKKSHSPYTVIL